MKILVHILYMFLMVVWLFSFTVILIVASDTSNIVNITENSAEIQDTAIKKDPAVAKDAMLEEHIPEDREPNKFTFIETLSQNSVVSNGLTDTGQPVIITLVDTATVNLQESLSSIATVLNNSEKNNSSNSTTKKSDAVEDVLDSNKTTEDNITKEIETPESAGEPPQPLIVIAEPKLDTKIETNKAPENITENVPETDKISIENNSNVDNLTKLQEESLKSNENKEEIPSFSEWAQKQLEEAEKKDTVVNQSTQLPHTIPATSSKLKLSSKNYASPDCGAKIVAANPEAGSPGSILSPSKDEYMLNTCNSRIWFIIELCEPIQAKKVEMANFELFSSTPKEFSVFFSDRFPTREWTSVGQFTAKDERDIQTFNLQPYIFGKFIKVELLSHYGAEHYCPVSMFKVYGTSEFEVLETENLIHAHEEHTLEEDDEDDEDLHEELHKATDSSKNLFGSARDAVMSIMKRAAQVLAKSNQPKNASDNLNAPTAVSKLCVTPSHIIVCDNCSDSLYGDVFQLLSCSSSTLQNLINNILIHEAFQNSDVCEEYGLDFKNKRTISFKNDTAVYISALFTPSYVAALCNMLAIKERKVVLNASFEVESNSTSNLTIDRQINSIKLDENLDPIIQEPFVTDKINKLTENDIDDRKLENVYSSHLNIQPTKTIKLESQYSEPSTIIVSTIEATGTLIIEKTHDTTPKLEDISGNKEIAKVENNTMENIAQEKQDKNGEDIKTAPQQIMKDQVTNDTINNDTVSNNTNGAHLSSDDLNINEQISLDGFLSDLDQVAAELGHIGAQTSTPSPSNVASLPQGQKESVFLRLSNRIKTLERNMSLSSQYLEELSRRYKKQVEEMQKTVEKTINTMSEESKRALEKEIILNEHIASMQKEMTELRSAVNILMKDVDSWFGNVTFFKFIVFQTIILSLFVYIFFRKPVQVRRNKIKSNMPNKTSVRRKSVEGVSGHQTPSSKKRRPSEEALHIARHSQENIDDGLSGGDWVPVKYDKKKRKRKPSVMGRPNYLSTTNENTFDADMASVPESSNQAWVKNPIKDAFIENTIALDEPEFVIPGVELVDFEKIGEPVVKKPNGTVNIKDYTKVNGSVEKSSAKQVKTRRLSSPAFLKSALSRQSSRNSSSPPKKQQAQVTVNPSAVAVIASESPSTSLQSSYGDISQNSKSPVAGNEKIKRGKSKSFKSIFKKVF